MSKMHPDESRDETAEPTASRDRIDELSEACLSLADSTQKLADMMAAMMPQLASAITKEEADGDLQR